MRSSEARSQGVRCAQSTAAARRRRALHACVLAACLLPLMPVRAASEGVIIDVRWEGVGSLSEAELRRALLLPVDVDSLPTATQRIAAAYFDAGYLQARFATRVEGETLHVQVVEGEPAVLRDLLVRGMQVLDENVVREHIGARAGDRYDRRRLEAGLRRLLHEYAARGYLYAHAEVERVDVDSLGVTVGIVLSEGQVATLREVMVLGNDHSRTRLVERIAGLRTELPASRDRIDDAVHTLRRSGLFAAVQDPLLFRTGTLPTDIGVLVRVVEMQRRNTVYGAVGVARNPTTGSPYVNGAFDLQLRNIWGTGRDLDLAWKRDAIRGSNLLLGYRERFLFGSPFDGELELGQTVRDSTYTYQTLSLGLELPLRRSLALQLGTAVDRSVFHTSVQGNSRRYRQRIGVRFQSDGREEDGGSFGMLATRLEYAQKRNALMRSGVADDWRVRQTLWRGDWDVGVPLWHHHVLGSRGQWFWIDSNEVEVPESELFWYGGARTLRGYREDQFRADQVLLANLEYRIGDPRTGRLYGFVDAAGHRRRLADGRIDDEVHVGYGLGLRAVVPSGVFDLSFGIGEERSLSEIKVHVSLQQRF